MVVADYAQQFTDLAVTGDGRVFACTFTGLYELDLAANTLTQVRGFASQVNGLGSVGRGHLYVGGATAAIAVLDDRNFFIIDTLALPAGTSSAGDIYVQGDTLYYTTGGQRLLSLDRDTGAVRDNVADGLAAAYGLHRDGGKLYVYNGSTAWVIDPDTGARTFAGSATGIGQIWGAASVPATLHGGNGRDSLTCLVPGAGAEGRGGNDRLEGSAGGNRLDGGADADRCFGRGGADTLIGGTGADTLTGGKGGDSFVFRNHCGPRHRRRLPRRRRHPAARRRALGRPAPDAGRGRPPLRRGPQWRCGARLRPGRPHHPRRPAPPRRPDRRPADRLTIDPPARSHAPEARPAPRPPPPAPGSAPAP